MDLEKQNQNMVAVSETAIPAVVEAEPIDSTTTMAQGIEPSGSSKKNKKDGRCKNRRTLIIAALVVACLIVLIIILWASNRGSSLFSSASQEGVPSSPTPSPPISEPTFAPIKSLDDESSSFSYTLNARIPDGVVGIGCFQKELSPDMRELPSDDNIIEDCSKKCLSQFFGISGDSICACFVDNLNQRLSLGSCSTVEDEVSYPPSERMSVFFKQARNEFCSQSRTETVRNFLVEEDDTPFGFDIIDNRFRSSPFVLYKDECGTNIYEVQTEVSEGSQFLNTNVENVRAFALNRRSERTASLQTSADASYNGLFFSAAVKVSASADTTQTNLFKSSGASESNSRVFTSTGVKRIAEIKIDDFENRKHFLTFSSAFGNALREYRDKEFSKDVAYRIIRTYGQFVLTRGIFGGYMQLRTTMLGSDISDSFTSEQRAKDCYEASVAAEAGVFGFKAKGSVSGGECTDAELNTIRQSRDVFETEVTEQTVVGGRRECSTCNDFSVEASDAALLTTKDKYPVGDVEGVEFRLLSDFIAPEKVSPGEIRRLHITEDQFANIQKSLQNHILDYINEIGDKLDICNCGVDELPYLDDDEMTGKQICKCYVATINSVSATEISLNEQSNYSVRGNRRSCAWNHCPSEGFYWDKDCPCKNGINQCHLDGQSTHTERFNLAKLSPTENAGVWKMESSSETLRLGEGWDCASGNSCFDDPLRGGFRIDLTNTGYEFAEGSVVTVSGWSVKMRTTVDYGTRLEDFSTNATGGSGTTIIPAGTRNVKVICGGWCGGCTSELYVRLAK